MSISSFVNYPEYVVISSLGSLDILFVHQWQRTLIIFNAIILTTHVSVMYMRLLAQNNQDGDWLLPIVFPISFALIMAGIIKTYVNQFVTLSKI